MSTPEDDDELKCFTIEATVDCTGVYHCRARDEDHARELFEAWDGGESVEFSHYAEEMTGEIRTVREED